jgi:AcrR family transcriptional regulator
VSSAPAPGRPRDPARDRSILDAAASMLLERGYGALTIEAVAEAAGVARPTVYRRYADRPALAGAALAHLAGDLDAALPADARTAVVALLAGAAHGLASRGGFALVGTLLAEEDRQPELVAAFRRHVLEPRHARVLAVLRDGVERAEVRGDADLELAIDLLFGALLARAMSGGLVDDAWVRRVVDGVWSLLAPESVGR